ncbi:DUF1934 family protein [Candidatus Izimaplasma bacterium ZiA1]|uniref:DUF1934 family protein n=1 Tax=Candidatus Izimoplasma sp. ZiA1 TaxID=2024899 RepID=UPI00143A025D
MKKVLIKFCMDTSDSNVSYETTGYLKANVLKFIDQEENENKITIGDSLKYQKKGSIFMDFDFIESTETKGIYEYQNLKFDFTIFTHKLTITKNNLEVDYSLFQDGILVNKALMEVHYCTIKEENNGYQK